MEAQRFAWRMKDRLVEPRFPVVMGILNATPDSFFAGSRVQAVDAALERNRRMLEEGATIIDVGGASSRPGAVEVPQDEELRRVIPVIEAVQRVSRKHGSASIPGGHAWRARPWKPVPAW